jgi:hypothetical protein
MAANPSIFSLPFSKLSALTVSKLAKIIGADAFLTKTDIGVQLGETIDVLLKSSANFR